MNNDVIIKGRGIIKNADEALQYKQLIRPELWRKMDDFSKMAVIAARLALLDAGVKIDQLPKDATGVIIATLYGPVNSSQDFIETVYEDGYEFASAFCFPNTVTNMAAGMISIDLGVRGPNCTIIDDNNAIQYARELLSLGKAEYIIAGSVNLANEITHLVEPELASRAEVVLMSAHA